MKFKSVCAYTFKFYIFEHTHTYEHTYIFIYASKHTRTNKKTGLQILMQEIIAINFVIGAWFIVKWLTSRHTNKARMPLSRVLWGYSSEHFTLKRLQSCSNLQISTEKVHVSPHHDFALWSHLPNYSPMLNQKIDISVRYGLFLFENFIHASKVFRSSPSPISPFQLLLYPHTISFPSQLQML